MTNKPKPKTIVCIEDDEDFLELLKLILEQENTNLIMASGGASGLRAVQEHNPDLVLLDLMMNDMHGWEVYMKLRAGSKTKDIPVIVVTAMDTHYDRTFGVNIAKVADYITKPFLPSQLRQSVDTVLHN